MLMPASSTFAKNSESQQETSKPKIKLRRGCVPLLNPINLSGVGGERRTRNNVAPDKDAHAIIQRLQKDLKAQNKAVSSLQFELVTCKAKIESLEQDLTRAREKTDPMHAEWWMN